jgi:H+/gluconate symporter-like permease
MVVVIIIGFIVAYAVNIWIGAVVSILGVVAFLWYNSKLTKKQESYKIQLVKQWMDEQKQNSMKVN